MTTLTPRLASAGREPRQSRLGLTALVVDVLVRLADAYIKAENAVLRAYRGAPSTSASWPAQAPPTTITTAALAVTNGRPVVAGGE